jgi:hypothetical protein
MNKEFIPYKQALALKELGFNETCFTTFNDKGVLFDVFDIFEDILYEDMTEIEDCYQRNSELAFAYVTAPLYQQAFRWFREKYNLNSFVIDSKSYNWYFNINDTIKDDVISEVLYFKTYEEAELECLKKLISIVKKTV